MRYNLSDAFEGGSGLSASKCSRLHDGLAESRAQGVVPLSLAAHISMAFDLINSFPTLQRAPITEAIIDIRATLPESVTLDDLASFNSGAATIFSGRTERHAIQTKIEYQVGRPPKVVAPSDKPDGYLFHAPEQFLIAQARFDGFTLSRLRPYHDGDTFIRQAREYWARYIGVARPTRVTRIAVRNVNRIEMEPGSDFQRYILTGPEISRALPQMLQHFFLRFILPDADSGATAVVTEAIGPPEGEMSSIPLIFDIDTFLDTDLSPTSDDIWQTVSVLRKIKNRIFFRSLTTEALEAFR